MLKCIKSLLKKIRMLIMPHIYDLNPKLKPKAKKEPVIEKAPAPKKKRGRPKKDVS